jgi:hypothetical protein
LASGALISGGTGSVELAYNSAADDFAQYTSAIYITQTSATETDIKNIRCQLTSAGALTNKHMKSIYSRVDVNHAVMDAYCFQGSMRVGANGTPSLLVYGISQSLVLNPTAHTQLTEARCIYASISGGEGVNGTSTVYMGVVSNTDTTNYTTAVYEGNVAAFCKVETILHATGQGAPDQIIRVSSVAGTPAFAKFDAATAANCIAGSMAAAKFAGATTGTIKCLIGATPIYIPYYDALS